MENLNTVTPEEKRELENYLSYIREKKNTENYNRYQINESSLANKLRQKLSELNPDFAIKGNIKKLAKEELDLLQFCHDTDMKKFLKEEFEKHPLETPDPTADWMMQ